MLSGIDSTRHLGELKFGATNLLLFVELLGAIALPLWGLRLVRTGVMRSYGPALRKAARNFSERALTPFIVGCLMAAALQSSAATALIVAGFSAQSAIGAATAFIAILGADVGTAIATIVVSQKVPALPQLLIAVGVFWFLQTEEAKWRKIEQSDNWSRINLTGIVHGQYGGC